jgi:hypothetical protein
MVKLPHNPVVTTFYTYLQLTPETPAARPATNPVRVLPEHRGHRDRTHRRPVRPARLCPPNPAAIRSVGSGSHHDEPHRRREPSAPGPPHGWGRAFGSRSAVRHAMSVPNQRRPTYQVNRRRFFPGARPSLKDVSGLNAHVWRPLLRGLQAEPCSNYPSRAAVPTADPAI